MFAYVVSNEVDYPVEKKGQLRETLRMMSRRKYRGKAVMWGNKSTRGRGREEGRGWPQGGLDVMMNMERKVDCT